MDQNRGLPVFSIDDAAPEAVATKLPPFSFRWERGLEATQGLPMHDELLRPGDHWSDLGRDWAELIQDGRVVVR